jgi:hypothetical protein
MQREIELIPKEKMSSEKISTSRLIVVIIKIALSILS